MFVLDEDDYLAHYGVLRRSGRYPWGSGESVEQSRGFLQMIQELFNKGMSPKEVAQGIGLVNYKGEGSTTMLRAEQSIAKDEIRASEIAGVQALKTRGFGPTAISERMNIPEPTVRSYLKKGEEEAQSQIKLTADLLRRQVDEKRMVDIGAGTENYIGCSIERKNTALHLLRGEGYNVYTNIPVPQLGTNHETRLKVLAAPDVSWGYARHNTHEVRQITEHFDETGRSVLGLLPTLTVNPKRVGIIYKEDGGAESDGVMFVRHGVKDLSLGGSQYAQVRIRVGDDHYLKGMAIYKDDLPKGIDIQFNTNKTKDVPMIGKDKNNTVLKQVARNKDGSVNEANPFGAAIKRQVTIKDKDGKDVNVSAANIVNEEGDWNKWSKSIASQVLSKQSPALAREQLAMTQERRVNELKSIMALTNPTVKRHLLEEYALSADAAAVHLKAAALPRQRWQTILPISTLKDNEVFAPNFNDGERVALIRYPHGGTFEIPELTVNNKHPDARRIIGKDAKDAIGINAKTAERLSGADFDGDTVLVIPNNSGKVKSTPALEGLKNFDAKTAYPSYPGMKVMSNTQMQMGMISNLITDMTIRKASDTELAAAVRHSMVVIDAEKHELNWKESEKRNNIKALKAKYQSPADSGDGTGGAATIISRAGSEVRIPDRKARTVANGGPIDKKTGELMFEPTGKVSYRTGEPSTTKVKRLALVKDAHELTSGVTGTQVERLYADHSNKLKALANQARLEWLNTPTADKPSASAKEAYSEEVKSLHRKLDEVQRAAPLERQAQNLANAKVKAIKADSPDMDYTSEKRVGFQALEEARNRVGYSRVKVEITPNEWQAIQQGAISDTALSTILKRADMDKVKELATPISQRKMTNANVARAKSMLAQGWTRAEVAAHLGVAVSTLDLGVEGGE